MAGRINDRELTTFARPNIGRLDQCPNGSWLQETFENYPSRERGLNHLDIMKLLRVIG